MAAEDRIIAEPPRCESHNRLFVAKVAWGRCLPTRLKRQNTERRSQTGFWESYGCILPIHDRL
jgi:hypothetical protein